MPKAPKLSISTVNNQSFVLSWPAAATGYVLESVGALTGESWLPVTGLPTSANGEIRIVRNVSGRTQFFRLALAPVSLAAAEFAIAGYQLISRTTISPTLSEETYKADLSNWSAADAIVSATHRDT